MESNQMKMREALVMCSRIIGENGIRGNVFIDDIREAHRAIAAALAAPERNCDVGTEEEQAERQKAYCRKHFTPDNLGGNCRKCPLKNRRGWSCQLAWAQIPYEVEKGEADRAEDRAVAGGDAAGMGNGGEEGEP